MTKVLVDTNILIYSVQKGEKKHHKAVKAMEKLADREKLAVSTQNLAEFSRVLREKAQPEVDHETVKEYLFGFMKFSTVLEYSGSTVIEAISLSKTYGIHFFDALLAATMQENGIKEILTENEKDFAKVNWINATNPFR
jgi:predicted nucleic acid-binding protein